MKLGERGSERERNRNPGLELNPDRAVLIGDSTGVTAPPSHDQTLKWGEDAPGTDDWQGQESEPWGMALSGPDLTSGILPQEPG